MKSSISRPLPRREFLRLSATAAVGFAASGLIDPRRLLAATTDTLPLLSIGFAGDVPESGGASALKSASSMLMPDPAFLRHGAQLAIVGAGTAVRSDLREGGIEVDAIYPVLSRTADKYPRFIAWKMEVQGENRSQSSGIRFTMPVTATDGIKLLVHRTSAAPPPDSTRATAPDAAQQNLIELSLGSGDGPKLQRGAYVIAFRESAADTAPVWTRLALQNRNGAFSVEGLRTSYIVLTVDYVKDEPRPPAPVRHRAN